MPSWDRGRGARVLPLTGPFRAGALSLRAPEFLGPDEMRWGSAGGFAERPQQKEAEAVGANSPTVQHPTPHGAGRSVQGSALAAREWQIALGHCVVAPPPPPPVNGTGNSLSPGQPTPGVVKQDKSSRGSVDTTKTRSDPQRVRVSSGERQIGVSLGVLQAVLKSCVANVPEICARGARQILPARSPQSHDVSGLGIVTVTS